MFLFSINCLICEIKLKKNINNLKYHLCEDCLAKLDFKNYDISYFKIKNTNTNIQNIDHVFYITKYTEHSAKLLKPYKFNKSFCHARVLCNLLKNNLIKFNSNSNFNSNQNSHSNFNSDDIIKIDAVIPVPLDRVKLLKRGFNQVVPFAKVLANFYRSKLILNLLKKTKVTSSQVGLSAAQRQLNLAGAFSVNKNKLKGVRRVFLVDDVMTTGSTANSIAKVLKSAGIEEVYVFVLMKVE
jgi:ComF family protein